MEISISDNIVEIRGNIKSVSDYQQIKENIDKLVVNHTSLNIKIIDSISITSSIIGYFNKLVLKDKILLTMSVGNNQLMELLEELNLKDVFKARKV